MYVRFLVIRVVLGIVLVGSALAVPSALLGESPQQAGSEAMQADNARSPQVEQRIVREVRHELLMLPYYGVFDDLEYRVDGHTVVLQGYVISEHSTTKADAERAVKKIEGVDKVVNNIEVLPPSPMDDGLRAQLYRKIYGYGPLFKYANLSIPPIHIVVKNGRVILKGVVDNETDKNLVAMLANQVPGIFEVTNDLRVIPSH
jgi:BON domain-containing protein